MNNLEIVFVHLGKSKSKVLIPNMELIHQMFPQTLINCIVSDDFSLTKKMPEYVKIFSYKASMEVNEIFKLKSIDSSFRNGFWRYSLERLIAIESLHSENRNQAYLHVESDILLLPQFPLKKFLLLKQISWLPVNKENDIASLVYFPRYNLTKEFKKDLLQYMNNSDSPTDMKGLSKLRDHHPDKYKTLPSYHSLLPKLNTVKIDEPNESEVDFGGIFDGSKIGMWLTGIDPRNAYGFLELFSTEKLTSDKSYIDPSAYKVRFNEKNELYFENGDKQISIYNLHIHSKSLRIFSRNWSKEIAYLTSLSNKNKRQFKFYPRILIRLVVENLLKGTFLEFLYNSPMFSHMLQGKKYLIRLRRKW
jgi:hypothetical protein